MTARLKELAAVVSAMEYEETEAHEMLVQHVVRAIRGCMQVRAMANVTSGYDLLLCVYPPPFG